MYPLQIPGALELLVILLMVAIPVAFIVLVVSLFRRRRSRIEALEERVRDLESELEAAE